MNDTIKRFIPLVLLIAVLAAMAIPKRMEQKQADAFGEPLFSHALPEGAVLVQQDAAKDDEGGTTAALLIQSELDQQTLLTFYSDIPYPPAEEGQTAALSVKALDGDSISALKQAKLYEEGKTYWFIYLYSI